MANYICGKALLVITRDEDTEKGSRSYTAHALIRRVSLGRSGLSDEHRGMGEEWAREEFDFMNYGVRSVPARCHKMAVGDTMRFAVSFISHAWTDYWGESDSDLEYSARLLRHQKFSRNRKRVKRYRLWLKQCAKKQSSQSR